MVSLFSLLFKKPDSQVTELMCFNKDKNRDEWVKRHFCILQKIKKEAKYVGVSRNEEKSTYTEMTRMQARDRTTLNVPNSLKTLKLQ